MNRRLLAGGALAALTLAWSAPALCEPAPVTARVVWVREAQAYVAAEDSLALALGDVVSFQQRNRVLASGVVGRVLDRHLAVVDIATGSLARVKRPEQLRVLAERPAPGPAPKLRLGYPAASRARAHVACERLTIRLPVPEGAYRTESRDARRARLVRDHAVTVAEPWPDTLEISSFDESADEEIALERGELDIAVFWPGELSRHMREQSGWTSALHGQWSAEPVPDGPEGAPSDSAALAAPLHCLILSEPRLLPTVRALGADALARAMECEPEGREP